MLENDTKLILKALFDYIIPPGGRNQLPGASFLIDSNVTFSDVDLETFSTMCEDVSAIAKTLFDEDFKTLDPVNHSACLKELKKKSIRRFNDLIFTILRYYYTNEVVLRKIGVKSIPPFPDGELAIEGDMLLFEQVYLRGKIYRD